MIVKICGITRLEDALAAEAAGADMIGFVFAPSPRRVAAEAARDIIKGLEKSSRPEGAGGEGGRGFALGKTLKVGVFVNERPDVVRRVMEEAGLDLAQLHGLESPEYCRALGIGVIKAFRMRDAGSLSAIGAYAGSVRYLLLDAFRPGVAGGTGRRFDWALTEEMGKLAAPWLLAGGLNPGNVAEAVERCRPDGVDVSGGVESSPGVKDHQLLRRFVAEAKGGRGV